LFPLENTNTPPYQQKMAMIGLIPDRTLKERASCESIDVPLGQPTIDLLPESNKFGGASRGSSDAPITINFPLTLRPPRL
jgi:hypothetical protein